MQASPFRVTQFPQRVGAGPAVHFGSLTGNWFALVHILLQVLAVGVDLS